MSKEIEPNTIDSGSSEVSKKGTLEEIRRVFEVEIEGLQYVLGNVDRGFVAAVEAIRDSKGKVVVTGVGKSGIIASKIAATLTSTGTSAVFLHPGEALHGDVGIVGADDVVIAIGKSGESPELNNLITVLKRIGVTLIGIVGTVDSTLGRQCDLVINVEVPREACTLNLAPTASSTAALAAGDAIAVALMRLKDFTIDEFALHHPGGQLGKRLTLKVSEIMRSGEFNPRVSSSDSIKTMLIRIAEGQAGAVSVVDDDDRLVGLVTDFDIRRALESEANIFDLSVEELMNPKPIAILESAKAVEALTMMTSSRRKRTSVLPVVDDALHVVGLLHLADLVASGI